MYTYYYTIYIYVYNVYKYIDCVMDDDNRCMNTFVTYFIQCSEMDEVISIICVLTVVTQ